MDEPLPTELTLSAFHVRDADALDVARARLRRGDLATPFRGVRILRGSAAYSSAAAYGPLLRPGYFFSHVTSAQLWGMWLPVAVTRDRRVHVAVELPARTPRMTGVVGHKVELSDVDVVLHDGLPVASPIDTWRQLSTLLSLDDLIIAGDSLVRRQYPLLSMEQLVVALARQGRRRGAKLLRAAYAEVRAGCDSARETIVRLLLSRAGMPEPEVNGKLFIQGMTGNYFGDLVYRQWKVIVEYDGKHHMNDSGQYARDVRRLENLARAGWVVIRVLAEHLLNPEEVVARVTSALSDAGWRG